MPVRQRRLQPLVGFLALLALAAGPAAAQGRDKGVHCSAHGNVGSCDGSLECDRLWAEHVRRYHRGDGSGLDNVVAANLSPMGTPTNVTFRGLILGGGIGAMVGSLVMIDDSRSQAAAGMLGGAGLFITSGVVANRGAWGPVPSGVLGIAGGALLGASIGRFGETSPVGSPGLAQEQDATASTTAAGAAVGFAAGFALGVLSRHQEWPVGRWFGPQGRARVLHGPRRVGVVVAW